MASPSTPKAASGQAQRRLVTYGKTTGKRSRSDAPTANVREESPSERESQVPNSQFVSASAGSGSLTHPSSRPTNGLAANEARTAELGQRRIGKAPTTQNVLKRKRPPASPKPSVQQKTTATVKSSRKVTQSTTSHVQTQRTDNGTTRRIQEFRVNQSKSSELDGAEPDTNMLAGSRKHSRASATTSSVMDVESAVADAVSVRRGLEPREGSKRRPRLIDALAAQRLPSPEQDSQSSIIQSGDASDAGPRTPVAQRSGFARDARSRAVQSSDVKKGRKLKFTYSQPRNPLETMATDDIPTDDTADANMGPLLSESLLAESPKAHSPTTFAFPDDDDDDDGTAPKVAIKSVHELRRAGANNRFSDEMEDLLSRIGVPHHIPSTMRRNALLELANKLSRESFFGQFRDHGARDKIAHRIGEEHDLISAFAAASALVLFLSSTSAPNLLRQLSQEGIGKMLARLLGDDDDVDVIASRKASNISKISRSSLHSVRRLLLAMKVWGGHPPPEISPRTIALQLLDIFGQYMEPDQLGQVTSELESALLVVAAEYAQSQPRHSANYDFVVSVLEAQSSVSTVFGLESNLGLQRAQAVAGFLENTLRRWPRNRRPADSAALRLAINTTNTTAGAAAFDSSGLFGSLTTSIDASFSEVQQAIHDGRLDGDVYDGFLLILGVFINILEHCPPARASINTVSLEKLVGLYLRNHASMSEADSVEKSKLNVAVGYLAVLLGYLSLASPVQAVMKTAGSATGMRSLLSSIREFIAMYQSVDRKVHELEGLVGELQGRLGVY